MNLNYGQFEIALAHQKQQILIEDYKREIALATQKRQMMMDDYEREIAVANHRRNILMELEQKRIDFWNNNHLFPNNGNNHSPRYSSPVQSNCDSPNNADVSSNYGEILAESHSVNSPSMAQSPGSINSEMEEDKMPQSPSQIGVNSEEEGDTHNKSKKKTKATNNAKTPGYKKYSKFELEKAKEKCKGRFNTRKARREILKKWNNLDEKTASMWKNIETSTDPMNNMQFSGVYSFFEKENTSNTPNSPSFQQPGNQDTANTIHITHSPKTNISDSQ